jgi:hypothetical protein
VKEALMYSIYGRDMECTQYFGEEISWKTEEAIGE